MSAVPRQPEGFAGLRMSADEYLALGETHDRYELIDGVVVMSPSPTPSHSEVINEVVYQLKAFARGPNAPRVFTDTDLRVGPSVVYRPDLAAYLPARLPRSPAALSSPPDLVAEVLSPSNRALDLITKRRDYERFGVGEYWIFDPQTVQVRACQRPAADQPFVESLVTADALPSRIFPGFTLDLRPVRAIMRAAGAEPGE
jgi:Uma2 family endonuclease